MVENFFLTYYWVELGYLGERGGLEVDNKIEGLLFFNALIGVKFGNIDHANFP